MYYYKKLNTSGELECIQSCMLDLLNRDSDLISITEEEFNKITEAFAEKLSAEEAAAAQEYEDYVFYSKRKTRLFSSNY